MGTPTGLPCTVRFTPLWAFCPSTAPTGVLMVGASRTWCVREFVYQKRGYHRYDNPSGALATAPHRCIRCVISKNSVSVDSAPPAAKRANCRSSSSIWTSLSSRYRTAAIWLRSEARTSAPV